MAVYDLNGNALTGAAENTRLLENLEKWKGKSLVTDGNSLTKQVEWGAALSEYLGMTLTDVAVSGNEIARGTKEEIAAKVRDRYPARCDLVIIQGDTNISTSGEVADQMDGESPKSTWTARVNYLIRCVKAKYPNCIIVLMPDSVRYNGIPANPNIWYGRNRTNYEKMQALARYNNHLFWSFDGDTPFNPVQPSNYYSRQTGGPGVTPENDGTHPNSKFAAAKGKALAWWCGGITFDPAAPNQSVPNWSVTVHITRNLTGVTSSTAAADWQKDAPYTETLTASAGSIKSVKVEMGGADITGSACSDGKIMIRKLTGDLVITAGI